MKSLVDSRLRSQINFIWLWALVLTFLLYYLLWVWRDFWFQFHQRCLKVLNLLLSSWEIWPPVDKQSGKLSNQFTALLLSVNYELYFGYGSQSLSYNLGLMLLPHIVQSIYKRFYSFECEMFSTLRINSFADAFENLDVFMGYIWTCKKLNSFKVAQFHK